MEVVVMKIAKLLRLFEGNGAVCILCGRHSENPHIRYDGVGVCADCYREIMKSRARDYFATPLIPRLFAPFAYSGKIRAATHTLKFKSSPAYAAPLARLIYDALPPYYDYSGYDLILPVPIHPSKMQSRGYNQASLIAKELARLLGVKFSDDILFRIKATQPQMQLSRLMRDQNLSSSFFAYAEDVRAKKILLFDDIFTAGATVRYCRDELLAKGAAEVSVIAMCENLSKEQKYEPSIRIPHAAKM